MEHTDCGGELKSVPQYRNVVKCQKCNELMHTAANEHKAVLERLKDHDDEQIRALATSILDYPNQIE